MAGRMAHKHHSTSLEKKGSRLDKNTYRGITLLFVGSKLLARVVATRIAVWSEAFICEQQSGFRKGRGVDDASQVFRRVVEEVMIPMGEGYAVLPENKD